MKKTQAWIVTGGTNAGVMGLVGKTMAEKRENESSVCLGIATWGIVKNHEDLEHKVGKIHKYESSDLNLPPVRRNSLVRQPQNLNPKSPAMYLRSSGARNASKDRFRSDADRKGPRAPLDPYHTHFLFVDAGQDQVGQFGKEIELRAELEDTLCQGLTDGDEDSSADVGCVMILVVVSGGPNTLKTVLAMLGKERPIVVLANSGGAANDIFEYMEHGKLPENKLTPDPAKPDGGRLYADRKKYCADAAPIDLPKIKKLGEKRVGLYNHPLLTFFGVDDVSKATDVSKPADGTTDGALTQTCQTGFDRFLLEAILSNVPRSVNALMHAVSWGDPGIVKRQLEEVVSRRDQNLDSGTLTIALLEALVSCARERSQRTRDCVQTLLNFGASPRDIELDVLFHPLLCRYPLPLKELATRLLHRQRLGGGLLSMGKQGKRRLSFLMKLSQGRSRSHCPSSRSRETVAGSAEEGERDPSARRPSSKREEQSLREQSLGYASIANSESVDSSIFSAEERDIRRRRMRASIAAARLARANESGPTNTIANIALVMRSASDSGGASPSTVASAASAAPAPAEVKVDDSPRVSGEKAERQRPNDFGLYALENLVELSGYKAHVRSRIQLGMDDVSWMDLMMWSVLSGHFDLSRIIWLQSNEPLRAAVIARRLCLKLRSISGLAVRDELDKASNDFEDWAVGVLDEVEHSKEALDMLTCTAVRRDPQSRRDSCKWISMWSDSVIEEAAKRVFPCRQFLSHRHSQFVLDQYFAGHHRGSTAAIPIRTSMYSIIVQLVLHLLNWPFVVLGLPCALPSLFPVTQPTFHRLFSPEDDELEDDTDDEGDELDEDYFANDGGRPVKTRARQSYMSLQLWMAFWSIPKVKFTMHAVSNMLCVIILFFWLCIDREGSYDEWSRYVILEMLFWVFYVGRIVEEAQQVRSQGFAMYISTGWNVVDMLLFLINSTALVMRINVLSTYHSMQAFGCTYAAIADGCLLQLNLNASGVDDLRNNLSKLIFVNRLGHDFQVLGMLILCFRNIEIIMYEQSMREVLLILYKMFMDARPVLVMMIMVIVMSAFANEAGHRSDDSFRDHAHGIAGAALQAAQRMAPLTPSPSPPASEIEGVVRQVLQSSAALRADVCPAVAQDEVKGLYQKPWAYGMWATLGEFGDVLADMYSHDADLTATELSRMGVDPKNPGGIEWTPSTFGISNTTFLWLPLWLWLSTFVTTIFLVNLMIAKMTSSYEKIRSESLAYLSQQYFYLIAEFKDDRGHAPPINVITFLTGFFWISRSKAGTAKKHEDDDTGYQAHMGKTATMRLQARERAVMHRFHTADLRRKQQAMAARVADVQERTASVESMARLSVAVQRELAEVREQQSAILQRFDQLLPRRDSGFDAGSDDADFSL